MALHCICQGLCILRFAQYWVFLIPSPIIEFRTRWKSSEVNYSRNLWIPNMDNFEKSYSNVVVTNQPNYDPKSPKYNLLKEASLAPFPIWGYPANGCKLSLYSDGNFLKILWKMLIKWLVFISFITKIKLSMPLCQLLHFSHWEM